MADPHYARAVHALTRMIEAVSVRDGDQRVFGHHGENNLHVIPDMLARLGVMRSVDATAHMFVGAEGTPTFAQHDHAPSLHELYDGLEFSARWYQPTTMRGELDGWKECVALRDEIRAHRADWAWPDAVDAPEKSIEGYWEVRARRVMEAGGDAAILYPPVTGAEY